MKNRSTYFIWLIIAGLGLAVLRLMRVGVVDDPGDSALNAGLIAMGWMAVSFLIVWLVENESINSRRREKVTELERLSQKGDLEATFHLAVAYESGFGVEEDTSRAFELYARAANAGHRGAMYELGNCYLHGRGTQSNSELARLWFSKGAELGDEAARHKLQELGNEVA